MRRQDTKGASGRFVATDDNGRRSQGVDPRAAPDAPALELRGVTKTFPGVSALSDVDLWIRPGSVHALLGHNGSGKSTLIKCLAGVQAPDAGYEARVFGTDLDLGSAQAAHAAGLRFVHQDFGLALELGAADNIGLVEGYASGRAGVINWAKQRDRAAELLARFGFDLNPTRPLLEASPSERAAVAIVRAIGDWAQAGVLVLDEPTAALAAHEVDRLFALIKDVAASGASVVLVSHRVDEVMAIADSATILRDGRVIWSGDLSGLQLGELVGLIAQPADIDEPTAPARQTPATGMGQEIIQMHRIESRYLRGIDVSVRSGEILGVAGLLGSGREDLPYVLAGGMTEGVSGTFTVDGVEMERLPVGKARTLGITFVPADRGTEAIFDGFTTSDNVSIAALPSLRRGGMLSRRRAYAESVRWLMAVRGRADSAARPISTLSGGNQQKAVLARALSTDPRLLVLSEPTAGIDIGARQVIYDELRSRAATGLGVLMASSDIEDLVACCDRVIALRDGRIEATFTGESLTKSAIAHAIEGAHK